MPLESDFKQLEEAHRRMIVAYAGLTDKKVKSRAPELRKALMEIAVIAKEMRKSTQTYKDRL